MIGIDKNLKTPKIKTPKRKKSVETYKAKAPAKYDKN